jgi:hypothetical protein
MSVIGGAFFLRERPARGDEGQEWKFGGLPEFFYRRDIYHYI